MEEGNTRKLRLLHTADVHMETVRDKGCRSLEALVSVAVKTEVDLIIIAGDFFDHNRVDNNLALFAIEQLKRLPVPAIILPGNHDCLVPDSVYLRPNLWEGLPNVSIIQNPEGETHSFPSLRAEVWGRPLMNYSGDVRPMAEAPRPNRKGYWHVAIAHGYFVDTEPPIFPSLHISHEEVSTSGYDYVALGHWPNFRCVCPAPVVAYYCESPSWLFPNSTVNIVDFTEGQGVQVTRYPL